MIYWEAPVQMCRGIFYSAGNQYNRIMQKIDVLGVQISAVTTPQALTKVEDLVRDKKDHYIVLPIQSLSCRP
jgi:hypothetical protein